MHSRRSLADVDAVAVEAGELGAEPAEAVLGLEDVNRLERDNGSGRKQQSEVVGHTSKAGSTREEEEERSWGAAVRSSVTLA